MFKLHIIYLILYINASPPTQICLKSDIFCSPFPNPKVLSTLTGQLIGTNNYLQTGWQTSH